MQVGSTKNTRFGLGLVRFGTIQDFKAAHTAARPNKAMCCKES